MKMGVRDDYQQLRDGIGLVERIDRGLLEARGRDRLTWLHSFVTNAVKHLGRGEGTYAFALNGQGRILFDVNIIVEADFVWLDIARQFLDVARKHLNKYVITEDVTILDRSEEFAHFGMVGGRAAEFFAGLGVSQFSAMASLGSATVTWNDTPLRIVRNDFCGPIGGSVFVSAAQGDAFRAFATDPTAVVRAVPVGDDAVQVHRIEAGIPWPGREITDEYLPAETRQLERAVSYTKGCYLGQEVVERMRSRKVVARQLVGLTIDSPSPPPSGSALFDGDGKGVGMLTSACRSIALDRVIALGYAKSSAVAGGTTLVVQADAEPQPARVVELPFAPTESR